MSTRGTSTSPSPLRTLPTRSSPPRVGAASSIRGSTFWDSSPAAFPNVTTSEPSMRRWNVSGPPRFRRYPSTRSCESTWRLPLLPPSSPHRPERPFHGTSPSGFSWRAEPAAGGGGIEDGPESARTRLKLQKEREADLDPNPQSHLAAPVAPDAGGTGRRRLHAAGRRTEHR